MARKVSQAADDLVFLLSIVIDPKSLIARQQQTQQPEHQPKAHGTAKSICANSIGDTNSASWQQTLASLPIQRRKIMLELQRLANAHQKWNDAASSSSWISKKGEESNVDYSGLSQKSNEADALGELENVASAIRSCIAEYRDSMTDYRGALRSFATNTSFTHNSSELSRVGNELAFQLIRQLKWDENLTQSILTCMDEELYINGDTCESEKFPANDAIEKKLRVWSEAMSQMISINKKQWNFVEQEMRDDMELCDRRYGKEEAPDFRNGETSQILPVFQPSSIEPGQENTTDDQSPEKYFVNDSIGSLHESISSSASVEEAVDTFVHGNLPKETRNDAGTRHCNLRQQRPSMSSILLVGETGCGKTHLLNCIQQRYTLDANSKTMPHVKVLRPDLDLVGNTLGSNEDRLIALFAYAFRFIATTSKESGRKNKCLILLDDIDHMFSLSSETNGSGLQRSDQFYTGRRCKALFLRFLDNSLNCRGADGHILVLCTSKSGCTDVEDRFDRTFWRGLPNDEQRRQLITSCFSADLVSEEEYVVGDIVESDNSCIEQVLPIIVHHSAGRSAVELSQCCREVLLSYAKPATSDKKTKSSIFLHRLLRLDKMLQTKSPQSLRSGLLDGVVDMQVFTSEELQSKLLTDAEGTIQMPLLGADARIAYETLMNVVITPLCQSDEIRNLLYGGGPGTGRVGNGIVDVKPTRVGCLISGEPGVGKTTLAYHCSSLAAKMSRVSLLDVSCTSLIHKEIGKSERSVQRLFSAVRAAAPCILLLDGIENVAHRRGNDSTTEGTMDRILSTFLTEMDGIETGGSDGCASGNVAVIGVTHNPDIIDPSLLRPGRLEKIITLSAPDFGVRKEIVRLQLNKVDMDFDSAKHFDVKSKDDVSHIIATESAGMSAMEVVAICREASMECLRDLNYGITEKPILTYSHFKRALSKLKYRK